MTMRVTDIRCIATAIGDHGIDGDGIDGAPIKCIRR
jgi:hypothetical protein